MLLPPRSNARGGKDGQEMEPAGSEAPSKGGTKVKQPSPSSPPRETPEPGFGAEHPCRGWWFRPILTTPGDGDEMRVLLDVLLNPKAIEGTRHSFAAFIRRKQCRQKDRAVSLPHRTQKEMFYRRVVQHQPGTFRARVFPVCLYLSIERVTELRSHAMSICFLP